MVDVVDDADALKVRRELEQLAVQRKVSYSGLSRLLGRNAAYIQQFITRGSPRKLDEEDRRKLAEFFGVSETLLGGSDRVDGDDLIEIPILRIEASAGFGAIATSEDALTRFGFDERWLRARTGAKKASLSIIRFIGDSMVPTLHDGDEGLVDSSDNCNRLRDGIYVLRSDDTIMVKRIALQPGSSKITISSDNAAYPTWHDMDRSEVHIVGRVIWIGRAL